MKVAILGTRGIPASYSGFETAAEQLAGRLSARGHEVVVYCRHHVVDRRIRMYQGARLVHLPAIRNKYLDTFSHTLLSAAHCARVERPDAALFFIAGNAPLCVLTRRRGIPSVINVDGLDSDRRKWPAAAKAYLRWAERGATAWADHVITDSHAVARVFADRYGHEIDVVPYGVTDPGHRGTGALERLGLEPRRYVLFVGRLEPENNPHLLVEAWSRLPYAVTGHHKLVIVGGAPYADDYIRSVHRAADPRVVFPGYVFGQGYWELQHHAYLFCAPTEVGGTHPVILEAMAAGACVLVNDHAPNVETVGEAGFFFAGSRGADDLAEQLANLLAHPEQVEAARARAVARAAEYDWEQVTDRYEQLLIGVHEERGPGHIPPHLLDPGEDPPVLLAA